jgi:hypothetical protein
VAGQFFRRRDFAVEKDDEAMACVTPRDHAILADSDAGALHRRRRDKRIEASKDLRQHAAAALAVLSMKIAAAERFRHR